MVEFLLNNQTIKTDKPSGYLLLDFIRQAQHLTGTKIGCREGDCGACTILIGELKDGIMTYTQVTACLTPIGNVQGKHVVTIEGLNMDHLSPVQDFMIEQGGTQCGFCTPGFIVSLTSFCLSDSAPTYEKAIASIDGNICRCTGYKSIERAAKSLTDILKTKNRNETINWLIEQRFIPKYFSDIPFKIRGLNTSNSSINSINLSTEVSIQIMGGGSDLYVQKYEQLTIQEIQSTNQLPEIKSIKQDKDLFSLGGASTVSDMLANDDLKKQFPHLEDHFKLISSTPIRNIATIAGNFVNASPIGDLSIFFLALNADIYLKEKQIERSLKLNEFFKDYKVIDKSEQEILTRVEFKKPNSENHFNFEKVSKRIHLDIATVNSAIQIEVSENKINEVHISAGGLSPIPLYLNQTCLFLKNKTINVENIIEANNILQTEISPINDIRGTIDYKRLLARQLFYAHFIKLFPKLIKLEELV